ncbi:hypothetical protein TVAG_447490 [Trichomonas vaginalis G3]|uniref:Uncharacterized protein n=1 Tax=Trichomonas vaginalis (strain ATCC PRA-98 / G3) TaxID=412133 RepID=A2DS20_TRIV3|nr:protein CBG06246 family [Trichomonas vaginalis G3]EAY16790.1 hypothetical protein TVAG_447490 [Trichomonas vaginalis G3]KAI5490798.1 protein CBG06246 family [Trichomonas vaginalis G3]|eukprot:XP_001329013.1 hypothetical protein [Trichomonas vaginalis G3]
MGHHVEFIINPYISRGFYIATRDLTYENQIFMELGKELFSNVHYDFDRLVYSFCRNFQKQRSEDLYINITTLDIIVRILLLTDMSKGNLGFALKGCNELNLENFLNNNVQIKPYIVDFRVRKIAPKLYFDDFLSGDFNLNYKGYSIIFDVLKDKSKEEKYYMGFKAIQSIQECLRNLVPLENQGSLHNADEFRLMILLSEKANEIKSLFLQHRDDLPVLRNRTNAELIGFEMKSSSGQDPKEKKHISYIEDAFDNLDQYCEEIILNYRTLKNHIIDGYNNYYDEKGNLKTQSINNNFE